MLSSYFFSYPRSGKEWQEIRMMLFLHRCFSDRYPDPSYNTLTELVALRHFGYSQITQVDRTSSIGQFPPEGSQVFFILREAKAVLVSAFYYANFFMGRRIPGVLERFGTPTMLLDYVIGPWGVERFVRYLNDVKDLLPKDRYNVEFFYFEDQYSRSSVSIVPRILGVDRILDEAERDYIFEMSSSESIRRLSLDEEFRRVARLPSALEKYMLGMTGPDKQSSPLRVGTPASYNAELPRDIQEYIDQYVLANSRLEAYNCRYLGSGNS